MQKQRDLIFEMGPGQTWPTLPIHGKRAYKLRLDSMSHRGYKPGKFPHDVYEPTVKRVKNFIGMDEDDGWELYYGPDATTFMKASANLIKKDDKAIVISNGPFGNRWYKEIKLQGYTGVKEIKPEIVGGAVNLYNLRKSSTVKLVCVTINETAFGIAYCNPELAILRQKFPNAIICGDGVSALPGMDIDYSSFDYLLCSGHKLFSIMPGVGFVLVNQNAVARAKEIFDDTGRYVGTSLVDLHVSYQKWETPCTPNTIGIYCHGMVSEDMNQHSLTKLRTEMDRRSEWLYYFFNNTGVCKTFPESTHKSDTSIVIEAKDYPGGVQALVNFFAEKNILIAQGYGKYENEHIRIANYFAINESGFNKFANTAKKAFKKLR